MATQKSAAYCVVLCVLSAFITLGYSDGRSFYIGQFEVEMCESTLVDGQELIDFVKSLQALPGPLPSDMKVYRALEGKNLTGPAFSSLAGKRIPLTLRQVKLAVQVSPARPNVLLTAVSGFAVGKSDHRYPRYVKYTLDGFFSKIRTSSVRLRLNEATAHVEICIPYEKIAVVSDDTLFLRSDHARIGPDGAVCSDDFSTDVAFKPTGCKYTFIVQPTTKNTVHVGDLPGCETDVKGISFQGNATRTLVTLSFSATISSEIESVVYELELVDSISLTPECDYDLGLHRGYVIYKYIQKPVLLRHFRDADAEGVFERIDLESLSRFRVEYPHIEIPTGEAGIEGFVLFKKLVLDDCRGEFSASLKLPIAVPALDDSRIDLEDVLLKTDSTGALFGKALLPKCNVSSLFMFECTDSNAWVYFDNWADGSPHYPCDSMQDTYCKYTYAFFSGRHCLCRPGVTMLAGNLFFTAPQVDVDTLHTIFWGALTVTPNGIVGELTSGNYALVPTGKEVEPIENIRLRHTLDEIIAMGNALPDEPHVQFTLADLKVLEMNVRYVQFCNNRVDSSVFLYNVYFPHPSHINIQFVDVSLDENGYFHTARGPVTTEQFNLSEEIWEAETKEPILPGYGAEGTILWFWRTPIFLYKLRTVINHMIAPNDETTIHVNEADLYIAPLSSADPERIGGVPCEASFDIAGLFVLRTFEREHWFGKFGAHDFRCVLDSIELVDLTEQPDTRKYDLRWRGVIDFPFFDSTDVGFFVRNVVPYLEEPVAADTACARSVTDSLYVVADSILYSFEKSLFSSRKVRFKRKGSEAYENAHLIMQSYISAYLQRMGAPSAETKGLDTTITIGECGRPKTIITRIKDAVESAWEIDLVCYDDAALAYRNTLYPSMDLCGNDYWRGTFETVSIDPTRNDTTVVLAVPNAKYYFGMLPPVLDASGTEITFQSDEFSVPEPKGLAVPTMQLVFREGAVRGQLQVQPDIGAAFAPDLGVNIDFYMNAECGHFYFFGDIAFWYFVFMDGQLLVAHCPIDELDGPINRLAERAYLSPSRYKEECFGPILGSGPQVVTCVMMSGGVKPLSGILTIRVGGGYWYAQKDGGIILGGYGFAKGALDLYLGSVSVTGHVSGSWTMPGNTITLYGSITGSLCVSAVVGHCEASVDADVEYSTDDGFDWDFGGVHIGCGWGGCD